jgi:hypothetical protein
MKWRAILRFDALNVRERDVPHGGSRPLRLGLTDEEGWTLLAAARDGAERFVAAQTGEAAREAARQAGNNARLSGRSALAVSMWTRGRLRGSVVCPPGRALAMARHAGMSARGG